MIVAKTGGAGPPTPMPPELAAVWDPLWQDVVFLHTKWNNFRTLHRDKDSVDLLNFGSDEYFGINQMVWAADIEMAMARLTDPHQMGQYQNLTLGRLLLHIDPATPAGLHDKVKAMLDELAVLSKPTRDRRMKRLAHSDLDHRLGHSATLDPVTTKDIEDCLAKIQDIMNEVELAYLGKTTMYETTIEMAADELLHHLREAREYQRQERIRLGLPADPEPPQAQV